MHVYAANVNVVMNTYTLGDDEFAFLSASTKVDGSYSHEHGTKGIAVCSHSHWVVTPPTWIITIIDTIVFIWRMGERERE